MAQMPSARNDLHHVLYENEGLWLWSNEPSLSSAQAHADDQKHEHWTAIWIFGCSGEAACPVCVAQRKDVDEDETFRALTAHREPYWKRHGPR